MSSQIRKDFEAWATSHHGTYNVGKVDDVYSNRAVMDHWFVWNAACKSYAMQLRNAAYNEIIEFVLQNDDTDILRCWNEGDWEAIHDEWPEFNIMTEAQQNLMRESGFDPTIFEKR